MPHRPSRKQLVIMVKEPQLGRVKTRLGHDIGMVPALWWYRHQVARLTRRLDDRRWHLTLAISPDNQHRKSRFWPSHLKKIPQGGGNLGTRMLKVFRQIPSGPVCIIGSDIPDISCRHIAQAFDMLGKSEWVFWTVYRWRILVGWGKTGHCHASRFVSRRSLVYKPRPFRLT